MRTKTKPKTIPASAQADLSFLAPVTIPEGTSGGYVVRHVTKPPHERFQTASARCRLFGQPSRTLAYPHPTRWHSLEYEGGVWMTDLPCEQAQHRAMLRDYAGNVLVGGLGLGVFLSILTQNPKVTQVTIVEISKDVINLVAPHLPQTRFPVKVIHADLHDYLDTYQYGPVYDRAFYDTWQSDGEGTFLDTVVPLRRASKGKVLRVDCWNEDIMRGQLHMSLFSRYQSLGAKFRGPMRMLTLVDLAHPDASNQWLAWSAPFFRLVEEGYVTAETFADDSAIYADSYGKMPIGALEKVLKCNK